MKKPLGFVLLLGIVLGWSGCQHSSQHETAAVTTPADSAERTVASEDLNVPWAYDAGPAQTPMGKQLLDIVATQPYMPGISMEMLADQKFRPAFGPTLWRMIQTPNSVKILFIGQDGTHIAEAAGRTATAGFGGRAQDLAAYFGVRTGAAFMNAFAFTIQGQYNAFGTPVFYEENGVKKVDYRGAVAENGIWMMSQDQRSPMVMWRNNLIDWIIRNNRDSLKLIVLFGGAAQDSIGTFIEAHKGKVGSRFSAEEIAAKKVKVPMFVSVEGGSNHEFPVVLDKNNGDLYSKIAGGRKINYGDEAAANAARESLTKAMPKIMDEVAFSNGGINGSGVIHPAQIDGYDLTKIEINNQKTYSLRGLPLSDNSRVDRDVLIVEFPHPTVLSKMTPAKASEAIAKSLERIQPYVKSGWRIDADPGMTNQFAANQKYLYGRSDIGPAYYDFGTPKNRMVSVSSASRMKRMPNVVIIGTRDNSPFDMAKITTATKATAAEPINPAEMFSARPRQPETRYLFDSGPGPEMAKLMKQNLDMTVIGAPKAGMNVKQGIAALNLKTDPEDVGDFGHYRGTFVNPKVLILADPAGADDILTSRALTGTRGQFLHGLMRDLRVGDQYLVIKTVPFGMDGANEREWATILQQTGNYRQAIFKAILAKSRPVVFIADGKYAAQEMKTLLGSNAPFITINRSAPDADDNSGIVEAGQELAKRPEFRGGAVTGRPGNIPRTHLAFMARNWEGTSGTRVFESTDPMAKGTAFAIVAPEWAYKQTPVQSPQERQAVDAIKRRIDENKVPRPNDNRFIEVKRRNRGADLRMGLPAIYRQLGSAA